MRRLRWSAYLEQDGECFWCYRKMTIEQPEQGKTYPPTLLTVEHLIMQANGGKKLSADNIVAACMECNTNRHEDWPWGEACSAPKTGYYLTITVNKLFSTQ